MKVLTGVERVLADESFEAEGIRYVEEADSGIYIAEPEWDDVPDYMYGIGGF